MCANEVSVSFYLLLHSTGNVFRGIILCISSPGLFCLLKWNYTKIRPYSLQFLQHLEFLLKTHSTSNKILSVYATMYKGTSTSFLKLMDSVITLKIVHIN